MGLGVSGCGYLEVGVDWVKSDRRKNRKCDKEVKVLTRTPEK